MKFEFDTANLKKQIEDQPLIAAGIGAAFLSGGAKLLDAITRSRNAKTYRKEINRRTRTLKR